MRSQDPGRPVGFPICAAIPAPSACGVGPADGQSGLCAGVANRMSGPGPENLSDRHAAPPVRRCE